MWVEYNIASNSAGAKGKRAIDAYKALRAEYASCTNRDHGLSNSEFALEVLSAGVIDAQMLTIERTSRFGVGQAMKTNSSAYATIKRAATLSTNPNARDMCTKAMPAGKSLSSCIKLLQSARYR